MKEDYLWDKSGEDAGIERLENALKAFRYRETAPPALPVEVLAVEPAKPRRFFQFGFAFAGSAAVVVICFAVWVQLSGLKLPAAPTFAETNRPKSIEQIVPKEPAPAPIKVSESTPVFSKSKVIKTLQRSAPVIRPIKAVVRTNKLKQPAETLTAEEKYAYDQLMLALSITGSSLKIVKDKVDGIEEKTAVLETAR